MIDLLPKQARGLEDFLTRDMTIACGALTLLVDGAGFRSPRRETVPLDWLSPLGE